MAKKRKEKAAAKAQTTANKKKNGTSKNVKQKATPDAFPPELLKNRMRPPTSVQALYPGAVFVARGFLDEDECQAWVDFCDSGTMERVAHPATRWIAHRECGRMQLNDWNMADRLFERLEQTILPQVASQVDLTTPASKQYQPVACNGNLRLYRYDKGMSFGKHFDGSDQVKRYENGNTEITVLIYLSNCVGGATRFYPPKRKSSSFCFEPQAGAILLHVHGDRCLEHEADPVQQGVKYILRTDIVYADNNQVQP